MSNIEKAASEKQLRWLADLLKERNTNSWPATWQPRLGEIRDAFAACEADGYDNGNVNVVLAMESKKLITMSGFRALLEKLQASPYNAKAERAQEISTVSEWATEPGMYKVGDDFFKVKSNRTGTNLYAHKLFVDGSAENGTLNVTFRYCGGIAKNKITADSKLTYEDAKAFGALYGTCCCCGRLLNNELSIALGIGPVCGKRQFGGEFTFMIDQAKLAIGA